jgi:hypothetical protein
MKKINYCFITILTIIAFFIPDLFYINSSLLSSFDYNWDFNNILLWQYAESKGYSIFKDYWFPYTESSKLFGVTLNNLLYDFLYKSIIFTIFAFLLYKVFGNIYVSFFIFLFVLLGSQLYIINNLPIFWGIDRYLLSIIIVLSFCIYNKNVNYLGLFLFTIALLTYQDQLTLSFFPVLYLIIISGKLNDKKYLRKVFYELIIIISIISIYLFKLVYLSQFNGFIYFYKNYGDWYHYAYSLSNIYHNLTRLNNIDFIYIFTPLVSFLYGFIIRDNKLKILIQSFSILSIIVLTKYFIRPSGTQPLIYSFLCVSFIFFHLKDYDSVKYLLGILFALIIFTYSHNFYNFKNHFLGSYNRLNNTIKFIQSNSSFYNQFDYKRFKNYSKELILKDEINRLAFSKNISNQIYYFGEPSVLYILLENKIPYYTNLFDASSTNAQKKLIDWIDSNVNLLVIDTNFKAFDGVPNSVRSPLIINYLTKNFLVTKIMDNHIIAIRNAAVNDNLSQWLNIFGNELNFAKYYQVSGTPCSIGYIDLLSLEISPLKGHRIIKVNNNSFDIIFDANYSINNYICVPKNHFWFLN